MISKKCVSVTRKVVSIRDESFGFRKIVFPFRNAVLVSECGFCFRIAFLFRNCVERCVPPYRQSWCTCITARLQIITKKTCISAGETWSWFDVNLSIFGEDMRFCSIYPLGQTADRQTNN